MEALRLNKYISETGFCSRREADALIEAGRVKVNGKPAEMGLKVSDADTVLIDNKPLKAKPKSVFIAYHKPVGITCTTERKISSNIVKAVGHKERIFPIGRLDRPSEGLIFLTNDGDIVNKILRAGNNHEKEYEVWVDKPINATFIKRMAGGLPILDTVTKKCFVKQTGNRSFTIILTQGLNRQIRRMCEYLGYEVTRLQRTRIMNITLAGLSPGQWRDLSDSEMQAINNAVQYSGKTQEHSLDENKNADFVRKPKRTEHTERKSFKRNDDVNKDARSDKRKPASKRPNQRNNNELSNTQNKRQNAQQRPHGNPKVKGTLSLNRKKAD